MSAVDLTDPTLYKGGFDAPANWVNGEEIVLSRKLDASVKNLLTANTYKVFTLGDANDANHGYLVKEVFTISHTAEGGAATLSMGVSGTITKFEANADLNTGSDTVTYSADAVALYKTDTGIYIQPSADLDTAVFSVGIRFYCIDLTNTLTV